MDHQKIINQMKRMVTLIRKQVSNHKKVMKLLCLYYLILLLPVIQLKPVLLIAPVINPYSAVKFTSVFSQNCAIVTVVLREGRGRREVR